jgi:L-ascorbate metabolism protein UlaG (beta-lactamase superfamily)
MTQIRFFGVAAYELITNQGQHILMDPFLDENPGSPVKSTELEQVDLIVVSHAPFDHLGDTEAIARRTGAPVICGGEVKAYLTAKGLPSKQIQATTWGIAVEVAGIKVQPVECHHWSQIQMPDGTYASGVPMGLPRGGLGLKRSCHATISTLIVLRSGNLINTWSRPRRRVSVCLSQ